jgi:phosphopantothenoylcysteine decarboxylase/phosphopantothenate--cysteine ligase
VNQEYTSALSNKRLILIITASIAAYKSYEILRLLQKAGATVRVVLSRQAGQLVSRLAFQALSGQAVQSELFDAQSELQIDHIALARWAEGIVIAPATADSLAKMAAGFADELWNTLLLATQAPIFVAPAMNVQMWQQPIVQENIQKLQQRGLKIIAPGTGYQACGSDGTGRLAEPEAIVAEVIAFYASALAFRQNAAKLYQGIDFLITAGPTYEFLDSVRFLSNQSSGRMGYALAQAALELGATVTLVSGPVALPPPEGCRFLSVTSALEMFACVMQEIENTQFFIANAAVADYRPSEIFADKYKKEQLGDTWQLTLQRNPDILATVAAMPKAPFCLGFAAETASGFAAAEAKRQRKGIPALAVNRIDLPDQGFNSENNELTLIWQLKQMSAPQQLLFPKQSKADLALALLTALAPIFQTFQKTIQE